MFLILRRHGISHRFEVVNPTVVAVDFDAREKLLIAEQTRITMTEDGQSFISSQPYELAEARQHVPLGQL